MNIRILLDPKNTDSEIQWSKTSAAHISQLVWATSSRVFKTGTYRLGDGSPIRVNTNNPSLFELVEEKFTLTSDQPSSEIWFDDNWQTASWDIDVDSGVAFVSGEGFWILKSAMSGLWTYVQNKLPLHGSALATDRTWGICLVWSHKAWKTTGLLNLATILGEWTLVSDDWLTTSKKNSDRTLSTTDPSISISKKTFEENPHVWFQNRAEIARVIEKRKLSTNPKALLGDNYQTWSVQLDNLVLLAQWMDKSITTVSKIDDLATAAKFLVAATYHFPYHSATLQEEHAESWLAKVKDGTHVMIFDRSQTSWLIPWYKSLIDYIVAHRK